MEKRPRVVQTSRDVTRTSPGRPIGFELIASDSSGGQIKQQKKPQNGVDCHRERQRCTQTIPQAK